MNSDDSGETEKIVNFLECFYEDRIISNLLNKDKEIVYIDSYNITKEEKFISYLPHSGFHNQHGSLMNAIMLAYLTNRTLIVPPVLVYYFPPSYQFYHLYDNLKEILNIKSYRTNHCMKKSKNDDADDYIDGSYCRKRYSKYDKFTMLNWDQIFDLSQVKKYVRIVNRGFDEFSLDLFQKKFH